MGMRKLNNQGMTLIELILAMVISLIVIAAITMFVSTSSRSYQTSHDEISVQMEAQTILNQIGDLVQEGNNVFYTSTLYASGPVLFIYHMDQDSSTDDNMEIIWFDNRNHCMYLYKTTTSEKASVIQDIEHGNASEDNLLGEYLTDFRADTGIAASPDQFVFDRTGSNSTTLTVTLSLQDNRRTFTAVQDIKIRNKIMNLPATIP